MADTNLAQIQEQRDVAETQLATAHAKAELAVVESVSAGLFEQQPVVVPREDYPGYDHWGMGDSFVRRSSIWSSVDDRIEGRFRPLYEDAFDLSRQRAQMRDLAEYTSTAIGAIEALANYELGTGFVFTTQDETKGGQAGELTSKVQYVVDAFLDDNDFTGDLERELHSRSREDGEAFLRLVPNGWRTRACILEPDQIVEPDQPRELEQHLKTHGKLNYWWHGVHTIYERELHCDDPTRPLGYHAIYDNNGVEWDYIPANRMLHIKRNVSRKARRGVSDFLPVYGDLILSEKIRRNVGHGAAAQAAIAYIRQHAPGVGKSSIEAFVTSGATSDYNKPVEGGTRNTHTEQLQPGTVKDIPRGMQYLAGPMGSSHAPVYIDVDKHILAASIAVRWQFPYYMISGDASNSNFASTLVAESPFVKSRESGQGFYKRKFDSLLWKAIRIAWEAGRFGSIEWQMLRAQVSLKIDAPEVASRDKAAQAQTNAIENQAGVLSLRTWASESGRDYDEEIKNGAKRQEPQEPMGLGGAGQGSPPPLGTPKPQAAVESMLTESWDALEGKSLSFTVEV